MVETSGRLGPILGDGGPHSALSKFTRLVGLTPTCRTELTKTVPTLNTLSKYSPVIWGDTQLSVGWVAPVTDEDRARIWNGGPNGYKKQATVKYWKKVKEHL